MPRPKRAALTKPIHTFLALLTAPPPDLITSLLPLFTKTVLIHEHGLPTLAPFLGRDFTGPAGVKEYFSLLSDHLTYENMRFDAEGEWTVDVGNGTVCVRGWAVFYARATGMGGERGMGRGFGREGEEGGDKHGEWKIQEYRVWADTGAAYLALRGELGDSGI
ncbi:hypothetical protein BO71DRAFT_335721 [Aspergillus ellipticus CBS 707.79]|uniref:SnoaL-like domain-containing protein n=1 Tax=Aspergillus ellipticus CBS 707.79 TaxID=1448320 RepID=A0A319DP66_9EURO|nr:hypothetical protein BO71DRAFT_335721 [Aspergillus ellipticus CBS 707.79]